MTNTFEGSIFVSSPIEANQTVTDYVTQLMPQFNEKQIQEAVKTYTGIGLDTVFDQAVASWANVSFTTARPFSIFTQHFIKPSSFVQHTYFSTLSPVVRIRFDLQRIFCTTLH